jgi:hypothetical protein
MIYRSPHDGVQAVLTAVRDMLADTTFETDGNRDWVGVLRERMSVLDDSDSVASDSDVQTAREMYEGPDGEKDIQVDPEGYALASRGDDGVWVSAWVLIRTTPT